MKWFKCSNCVILEQKIVHMEDECARASDRCLDHADIFDDIQREIEKYRKAPWSHDAVPILNYIYEQIKEAP